MRLVVVACLLCTFGWASSAPQVRSSIVKGDLPTDTELDDLLEDPNAISSMVNCLIADTFDKQKCDSRLARAHAESISYFRTRDCSGCKANERHVADLFMNKLKDGYPKEHRRLSQGILQRMISAQDNTGNEDYYYDYDYE